MKKRTNKITELLPKEIDRPMSDEFTSSRTFKHKVVTCVLIYCACAVGYIIWKGTSEQRLYESIAVSLIGLASSVVLYSIGASAWQNISIEKTRATQIVPPAAGKKPISAKVPEE